MRYICLYLFLRFPFHVCSFPCLGATMFVYKIRGRNASVSSSLHHQRELSVFISIHNCNRGVYVYIEYNIIMVRIDWFVKSYIDVFICFVFCCLNYVYSLICCSSMVGEYIINIFIWRNRNISICEQNATGQVWAHSILGSLIY